MDSSQTSQNNYSHSPGNKYGNIVATISIALALLFWGIVYNKLEQLDSRLRQLEQATAAILAIQNDKIPPLNRSLASQPGIFAGPQRPQTP